MKSARTGPDLDRRMNVRTPPNDRPQVMHQRWESLLFAHWIVAPEIIQATLPNDLTVDTWEGRAYLGITPFFMRDVRPVGLPALPVVSYFQELNVRTYVYDENGVPGLWFYSLDCNQPVAVLAARSVLGLPYFLSRMTAAKNGWVDYTSRRTGTKDNARFRYRGLGLARHAAVDSLEFFLLERYCFYSLHRPLGRLLRVQVSHVPYAYRDAAVEEISTIPAAIDGFSLDGPPNHVCFVDGFDVRVYSPEVIGGRNSDSH